MNKILAQNAIPLGNIAGPGLGPLANQTSAEGGLIGVTKIVSAVIGFMTVAAGIYFLFMLLIGGYTWLSSMGDKHRLEDARNRIVNALIGLVIIVAGWAILSLVGQFFGWDILISSPGNVIKNLNVGP